MAPSLMSSEESHSISHYGSETAMELYNRAEQLQAGLGQDLINTIELVEEEEEEDASLASDQDLLHDSLGIGERHQSKRSSDKSRL